MSKLLSGSLAALLLLAVPALADDTPAAAKPSAATLPAELALLDFLAGSFHCTGTWTSEGGVAVQKHSRIKSEWKLDHYFLVFDYEQPATKEQPNRISGSGYWGWDASKKKYVHSAINNTGLAVTLYADAGDPLVFKGEGSAVTGASAQRPVAFTFKKTAKGFTIGAEVERDGKTVKLSEESCEKK